MISLGGGGLPRGEYDRFQIATPPLVWVVLHDSPWGSRTISPGGGRDSPYGEYIGLPRGGRTPTVGVTFSPVGKRPPLGGWDVSPIGGETPSG